MPLHESPYATGGVPLSRHVETDKGIPLLIALPVMVSGIRGGVGYFILTYGRLATTTFAMILATAVLNFPLVTWILGNGIAQGDRSLSLFALVFLALGLFLRHRRKQEKWDPDRPHAHSLGVTRFDFLPLPEDYIYRFVDPGITCLIGMLLRYRLGFALLGLYWIVAGVALFLVEFRRYQQTELNDWGLGDRQKEAERDGDVLKAMNGQAKATRSSRATHGIPTGIDGLAAHIEKNKQHISADSAERGEV